MEGRPRPGGLADPPGAAANDADDGALADAALAAVLVRGLKPARKEYRAQLAMITIPASPSITTKRRVGINAPGLANSHKALTLAE